MSQIFHRSANTIARVSIFGAVFFVAGLLGLFAEVNRSPWMTEAHVAREQPIQFSHERHVAGNGIDCRYCHSSVEESAFAGIPQQSGCGVIFGPEGFFYVHRARIAALALRRNLPTIFDVRDYVEAGGLASYGSDYFNVMELTGNYVARVLKGEKPADLPVQQPTKFEFVINLQTARLLGLDVPPMLLARADEVIE